MTSYQCRRVREQISSTQWLLNEARLHSTLDYRLNLLERSLFRPRAWRRFDFPDALFPLYALFSPLDSLSFHLSHRLATLKNAVLPGRARPSSVALRPYRGMTFRRLMHSAPGDVALAAEAAFMLTFFRIALKFLPVQRLTAWMGRDAAGQQFANECHADHPRVESSIDAAARYAPLTFVCFPRCLAAYFMLHRRHIASKLFYGVAREADQLKAHTWVKVGDLVVGGDVESQFTVLNTFP